MDSSDEFYESLKNLAESTNPPNRMTGDGLLFVVDALMKARKDTQAKKTIQMTIDGLIADQACEDLERSVRLSDKAQRLVRTCLRLIDGHKESI